MSQVEHGDTCPSSGSPEAVERKMIKDRDLRNIYPTIFKTVVPLKIGIFHDLLAAHQDELPRGKLYGFLGRHTSTVAYLSAVAKGGPRFAMDGSIFGEVTEDERLHALGKLDEIRKEEEESGDLARKKRSELRKAFAASGLKAKPYAEAIGMDLPLFNRVMERAKSEHAERQAKRQNLVAKFKTSGLGESEFAASQKMSVAALKRAIQKVATSEG